MQKKIQWFNKCWYLLWISNIVQYFKNFIYAWFSFAMSVIVKMKVFLLPRKTENAAIYPVTQVRITINENILELFEYEFSWLQIYFAFFLKFVSIIFSDILSTFAICKNSKFFIEHNFPVHFNCWMYEQFLNKEQLRLTKLLLLWPLKIKVETTLLSKNGNNLWSMTFVMRWLYFP